MSSLVIPDVGRGLRRPMFFRGMFTDTKPMCPDLEGHMMRSNYVALR